MSGTLSWSVGLLAVLILVAPMGSALVAPEGREDTSSPGPAAPLSDPSGPRPLWSTTLPGPLGLGEPIFYDDFGWCPEQLCTIRESDYFLAEKTNLQMSASGGDVWLVGHQNESTGNGELQYLKEGAGKHHFQLTIEPDSGLQLSNLAVAYIARGPADADGLDGGLRMQIKFWGDGGDPVDCLMVPSTPVDDIYAQHVPLNPLCNMIPTSSDLTLIFTVESGTLSTPQPGEVAIGNILIERV